MTSGAICTAPAYYLLQSFREHRLYPQFIWGRSNRQISLERFSRPYGNVEFAQYRTLTLIRDPAFCNKQKVELSIALQAPRMRKLLWMSGELIIKQIPHNTLQVLINMSVARDIHCYKIMEEAL